MLRRILLLAALTVPLLAAPPAILPERARPDAVNAMLRDRLDNLLPKLMRETGIDMWVIINREYVEDPVYLTIVPEPTFAARRTTMLVFFDRGEKGVERSEEHTSELQSPCNLVCRLLLEKKNQPDTRTRLDNLM